ncbi:MAG: hypothetical protein KAS04_00860 [Candidatus Aenigmarchaeota archaeon]|nr:hypothetical protein [Candidatus Aenigmarchaeota archaeon]
MDKEEKEVERWKTIVILSGNSTGKTIFDYVIKNNGYYVWNINPYNVIGKSAMYLGWDAVRDDTYHKFLDEIMEISEEYFEFKTWYARKMIARFIQSSYEPNVLVLHGYNIETSRKIVDEHPNVFTIDIRTIGNEVSIEHDVTLFIDEFDAGNFKKEVLKTIGILTKKLGDK